MSHQGNHTAPVAQLDRALPSEGKGRTFESSRVRHRNQVSLTLDRFFNLSNVSGMLEPKET